MIKPERSRDALPAAVQRLSRLATLDGADLGILAAAVRDARAARVRRELVGEGQEIGEARLIVSGWAARVRLLADGRRQFLSFLLPGDLIGLCHRPRLAVSSVVTLTDVTLCTAPPAESSPRLAEAYSMSVAVEESHLLSHITRLGRLTAQERISDLLLEFYERLDLAGLVSQRSFELPLTQETLADALGLTSVHVNRMLQQMRREGDIEWKNGWVTLPEPAALARKVGRTPVRVTAAQPAA